jgi:hypothetical protein
VSCYPIILTAWSLLIPNNFQHALYSFDTPVNSLEARNCTCNALRTTNEPQTPDIRGTGALHPHYGGIHAKHRVPHSERRSR